MTRWRRIGAAGGLATLLFLGAIPSVDARPRPQEGQEGEAAGTEAREGALAYGSGEHRPIYEERLDLPVAGDSIRYPTGITADPHTGEIFVADQRGGRILIFGPEGDLRYQIPGGELFSSVYDVAVDPEGYILAAVRHRLRLTVFELDFDGLPIGEVPLTGLPEGIDTPRVQSLALSPSGDRLYLLDRANLRVWIADREGAVTGSIDLTEGIEEDRVAEAIASSVDVSGDTVLVALSSEGVIRFYELDGTFAGRVGLYGTAPCQLAFPVAAARNEEGDFVIVDQRRMMIIRWGEDNRCIGEDYGLGSRPGFVYHPLDLALDARGRLYVTQGYEGRVQVYEGLVPAPRP